MKRLIAFVVALLTVVTAACGGAFAAVDGAVLSISGSECFSAPDAEIKLCIGLSEVNVEGGLGYVSFRVSYDKAAVTPLAVTTASPDGDTGEGDALYLDPGTLTGWEELIVADTEKAYIDYFAGGIYSSSAAMAGDICITLPFKVASDMPQSITFTVTDVKCGDRTLDATGISGKGGSFTSVYRQGLVMNASSVLTPKEGYAFSRLPELTASSVKASFDGDVSVFLANGNALSEGLAGTGCYVTAPSGDRLDIVIPADVTGEGRINAMDYLRVKRKALSLLELDGAYAMAADLDRNGKINAMDYNKIKRHVLRLVNIFE